ncbi:MAG: hypothetical protein J6R89_07500 [Clostridia bacterium]|nr:hypothetical protein [Clostridia bacterium]
MPYIETKTTKTVTKKEETALFEALGKAIELLPGKTEEDMAFITVALVGKAGAENYEKLTVRLCELCKEILHIAPDHVYVKYEEVDYWGWNNRNF